MIPNPYDYFLSVFVIHKRNLFGVSSPSFPNMSERAQTPFDLFYPIFAPQIHVWAPQFGLSMLFDSPILRFKNLCV